MCGRVGAAAIVGLLVAVGGIADARARSETLAVPRDVGELPRATFDWVQGDRLTDHPTGDLLLAVRDKPARVEAYDLRGRRVWASVLAGNEKFEAAATDGDLVVIATDRRVSALEKRTGSRRWLWTPAKGNVIGEVQARDGTFVVREDLPPNANGWRERRAFVLIDARTGRRRWRSECPEKMCTLVENAGDDLLVHPTNGFLRLDQATGTPGPRVQLEGKIVAAGGDAVLSKWAAETDISWQHGPIEISAHSASRGRPLWKVTLNRGDPHLVLVRRAGDAWVVLSPGRLDVLDAATGATRHVVQLPDVVDFDRNLAVLPDGRLVGVVETSHDLRAALKLVLIVDPAGARVASFWSLPDDSEAFLASGADHPLFVGRGGFGELRPSPLPAPRASRSLADEVKERLDRVLKGPSRADMRLLKRLDRSAYEAAVIARMDGATPIQLAELAPLLAPPPGTAAARDALSRSLGRVLTEVPRATPPRQWELFDAGMSLLEAWSGKLPEEPMRKMGSALGTALRERPTERPGPVVAAAQRYFDLLWRAPYPDLEAPLRAAIAAIGRTTVGRADCPPAKRASSEEEQIWADLSWQVLALRTEGDTTLLRVPEGSQEASCVDISTLGGPVIVGSETTLDAIKAGKPRLGIRSITSYPLSREGKASLDFLEPSARAVLGNAPLREAAWSVYTAPLNAGGHRAVIARVAGRWVIVTRFVRWIS